MRKFILLLFLTTATTTFAQSWGQGAIRILAGTGITVSFNNGDYTLSSTAIAPAGSVDSTSVVDGGLINADLRVSTITAGKTTPTFITNITGGGISLMKQRTSSSWEFKKLVGSTGNTYITDAGDSVRIDVQAAAQAYSGWSKPTSTRMQPTTLTDTVRVNRFRLGVSSTAGNVLKATDTSGNIVLGTADSTGLTDGGVTTGDIRTRAVTSVKIAALTEFLTKPDMLEFLGGALQATPSTGASDTTANYMPMKAFSVGDTATFDIFLSSRFVSLDSIVVYAYSNTATSAVVFNCGVRQTAVGDAIAGAFNTAATKTISTGTAGTLRQWSMTSFGSLTASTPSMLRGKIYRTAGGTGGDIFVNRVLVYGVGLR